MGLKSFFLLATLGSSSCLGFSFKNLVTFGDSYTDNVVIDFNRTAWPDFVSQYSKKAVSVYDFAHAGGTCSNKLTPRIYKPVLEAQIPEYNANVTTKSAGRPSQKTTYIKSKNGTYVPLASKDTLYSIWIGTNDVGAGLLLTDPLKDVSIVNTTNCVFDWMQELYNEGARNFLIQSMIPLYLLPMYSSTGYNTRYWNEPHNQTEWSIFIAELVRSGNELQSLRAQYVAPARFPGARIGIFDSYHLFQNMHDAPEKYLVGPTYNVTGAAHVCQYPPGKSTLVCTTQPPEKQDSFLWWDELHPSVQANRVVAREILNVLKGKGAYVTWYGTK